jgi:hypothetical protein
MAHPLKICTKCLAALRGTADGEADLGSYLMGIGAGGVELVSAEACEARITGHSEKPPAVQAGRSLADVTDIELDSAIKALVKQLKLTAEGGGQAWDLENAIKAEWLKALEARRHQDQAVAQ